MKSVTRSRGHLKQVPSSTRKPNERQVPAPRLSTPCDRLAALGFDFEMRVCEWNDVDFDEHAADVLVELHASLAERGRFERARRTTCQLPAALIYRGPGGDALAGYLAERLRCPLIERAVSIVIVPLPVSGPDDPLESDPLACHFSSSVHTQYCGEDMHLIIDAESMLMHWPPEREGDDQHPAHGLWQTLFEQLLVEAQQRCLPVALRYPRRRAQHEEADFEGEGESTLIEGSGRPRPYSRDPSAHPQLFTRWEDTTLEVDP